MERRGRRSYIGLARNISMGKIGYAPEWGTLHTKVVKDFEEQKGEQKEQSPKFTDVDKAMKWLNAKP